MKIPSRTKATSKKIDILIFGKNDFSNYTKNYLALSKNTQGIKRLGCPCNAHSCIKAILHGEWDDKIAIRHE